MNKHLKFGFTLIEVIIAMMISTMLMSAAFMIYNQINKSIIMTQKTSDIDTKLMILHDRLQQDFNGISPIWFNKQEPKDKNTETQTNNNKPEKHRLFYSENKDNRLHFFTFATTNAMQVYGNEPKRFVRVIYYVQAEPNQEHVFRLMRKEIDNVTANLDKKVLLETGTFYVIAKNIQHCSVSFEFINQPKHKDKDQSIKNSTLQKAAQQEAAQLRSTSDWGATKEQKPKGYKPPLFNFAKLNITFINQDNDESKEHTLYFTIPIDPTITFTSLQTKQQNITPRANESDKTQNIHDISKQNKSEKDHKLSIITIQTEGKHA